MSESEPSPLWCRLASTVFLLGLVYSRDCRTKGKPRSGRKDGLVVCWRDAGQSPLGAMASSLPLANLALALALLPLGRSSDEVTIWNTDKGSTKFYGYKKDVVDGDILLTGIDSLEETDFNRSLPLVVIIHGYRGNHRDQDLKDIRNSIMENGGYNTLMVDYSTVGEDYGVAAGLVGERAREVAELVLQMDRLNYTRLDAVTLLGFSLGAQLAALTARHLQRRVAKKIGRIIGLDPAKPSFEVGGLGPEDGEFVMVVHTCGGLIAQEAPLGHADFFPNGGVPVQPPCRARHTGHASFGAMAEAMGETLCSHLMAVRFFRESVKSFNTTSRLLGIDCGDGDPFITGRCSSSGNTATIGLEIPPETRGVFYLKTGVKPPYGLGAEGIVFDNADKGQATLRETDIGGTSRKYGRMYSNASGMGNIAVIFLFMSFIFHFM